MRQFILWSVIQVPSGFSAICVAYTLRDEWIAFVMIHVTDRFAFGENAWAKKKSNFIGFRNNSVVYQTVESRMLKFTDSLP